MSRDELVQSVSCYNYRPLLLHGYMGPFLTIYAFMIYSWFNLAPSPPGETSINGTTSELNATLSPPSNSSSNSSSETSSNSTSQTVETFSTPSLNDTELWLIAVIGVAILQVVFYLFCHWSVHVKTFLSFNGERNPLNALWVKVVPTPNNGSSEIVRLHHSHLGTEKETTWFLFQKTKYTLDRQSMQFRPVQFPVSETFDHYLDWKGYQDDEELADAKRLRGDNEMEMVVPLFMDLFKERATAPFFVFQVFCVGLWTMDEFWYYSIFTLGMLVTFEAVLVKQQLRNLSEIRKMGNKPYQILVYRNRKWRSTPTNELIAGDIVSISRSQDDNLVPCDMLLLRGSCIVDESMLTGESVPQMKEPLETIQDSSQRLDVDANGRIHILYAGTKVVQHTSPAKTTTAIRSSDNGCVCYVLRTGFNTSQGKLLRTILFGVKRVTANNLETFAFILFLLIFAIAAASYVWIKGSEDPKRNRYKLFLECTLILTSVVPPELPIELSLAVNTSLISLSRLYIFCTEPFRIPFAGKVEICCFDKTGTLTSDNLLVEGVTGIGGSSKVSSVSELPTETLQVLASCNSLAQLDDGMVGDPLEKATLNAIEWHLGKGDVVVPKKGKIPGIKIFQRFHFNSSLKRMSVVCAYNDSTTNESVYLVTVKGAPEVLKNMFKTVPDNYDELYLESSRKGARVLALGRKVMGSLSSSEVRSMSRDSAEKSLEFAGFLLISCPLKKDSKEMIQEILSSSHRITMITGDAPLTACHVGRELGFCKRKRTLNLVRKDDEKGWTWNSVDGEMDYPLYPTDRKERLKFFDENDLCLTGEAISYLVDENERIFRYFLPHVSIFARVTPKQKEMVITTLRSLGWVTLMCGDGTNDVGALKHAHAGVALLPNAPLTPPKPIKKLRKILDQVSNGNSGDPLNNKLSELRKGRRPDPKNPTPPVPAIRNHPKTKEEKTLETRQQIEKLMKEVEEQEVQVVKLGDASIAAPFTSKLGSIQCVCHIIKQGRCTLVTTLQMFKILALNALILAYSQSVLYLDGIKFSDGQATLQGLLLAGCFLCISRSKPLSVLSEARPLPNIFNVYTVLSVLLQFAVHFASLVYLVQEAKSLSDPIDPDQTEFKPSLLNSTVYIISIGLQISTFAVNYKGRPFMESLFENKPLLYSILVSTFALFALVSGLLPDMSSSFSIVDFPPDFQNTVMLVLIGDMALAFVLDRACEFIFGYAKLKQPKK